MDELLEELKSILSLEDRLADKLQRLELRVAKAKTLNRKERQNIKSVKEQVKKVRRKALDIKRKISRIKSTIIEKKHFRKKGLKLGDFRVKRPHIITPFDSFLHGKHSGTATAIWNTIKDQPNRDELRDIVFRKLSQVGPDALGQEWGEKYFDTVVGYDDKSDNAIYVNDAETGLDIIETWRNDVLTREEQEANKAERKAELGLED